MNARFIASNLKEAEDELRGLITRLESGKQLSFEDYHVAMAHIYHHLNSAWNGRNATDEPAATMHRRRLSEVAEVPPGFTDDWRRRLLRFA